MRSDILGAMLHAWRHPHTGELRLYIQGVSVEAWISQEKPAGLQHPSIRHGEDWVLWVRHGKTLTLENCPARLQVQSVLRAWLLQTYHRPLFAMRFGELHRIAQLQGARSVHLRS